MASIPPVHKITADDHGAVTTFIEGLVRESTDDRAEWVDVAVDNVQIYTYGELVQSDKIVINEIRNAVIAATDVQTREPPRATLEPVESDGQGEIYPMDPMLTGGGPIDPAMAVAMMQPRPAIDQATGMQQVDPMSGQPMMQAGAPPSAFVEVNDKLIADTYQKVFDRFWARAQVDRWVRSNLLRTNVEGWSFPLVEWDDDEELNKLRIRATSIKQIYIDPTVEDISEAAYAGIDLRLDADEAIKMFPHLEADIEQWAAPGYPDRPIGADDLGQANERKFERPTVTLRVFWLRNQPIPMGLEQAIARGKVIEQEVVDEAAAAIQTSQTQQGDPGDVGDLYPTVGDVDSGSGNSASQQSGSQVDPNSLQPDLGNEGDASVRVDLEVENADTTVQSEPADVESSGIPSESAGVNAPEIAPVLAPPPTRIAYLLADTGQEVTPDDPAWPQRRGIRQITILKSFVVDDRPCEHWDIPLLHNCCLPIPGKPWGMGEPFALLKIQEARNSIVNSIVEHSKYFSAPMSAMPESMYNATKKEHGKVHIKPNMTLIVPDDLWQQHAGKVMDITMPPPTPPALVETQGILRNEISEQSGHTDAMRGVSSGPQESGKKVELLQQASTSLIGFKSKRTGDMVERLSRLVLHCIVTRMTPLEIARIVSKYPLHIITAIHQRALQIEWDVNVIVQSGSGQMLAVKKQEKMQQYEMGIISLETVQEALDIDPQQESGRQQQQAQNMAAMGMDQEGEEKKKPPK
jgi:hypothetical protein